MAVKNDETWVVWAVRALLLAFLGGAGIVWQINDTGYAAVAEAQQEIAVLKQRTTTLENLAVTMPVVVKDNRARMESMAATLNRIDNNLQVHIARTGGRE